MANLSSSDSSDGPARAWVGRKPLRVQVNRPNALAAIEAWQSLQKSAAAAALAASRPAIQGMLDATQPAIRAYLSTPVQPPITASMTEALRPISERIESGPLSEMLKAYQGILESLNASTVQAVKQATRGIDFDKLQGVINDLDISPLVETDEDVSGAGVPPGSDLARSFDETWEAEELREVAQDFRKELGPRRISKLYQQLKPHPIYQRVSDDMRSIRQGGKRWAQQLSGQDRIALALLFAVIIYVTTLVGSMVAEKHYEIVDGLMEDVGWTPHNIAENAASGYLAVVGIRRLVSRRHPINKKVTRREWQ